MNTAPQISLNPISILPLGPPEFFDLLSPLKNFLGFIVEQLFSLTGKIATFVSEKIVTPIANAFNWVVDKIVGFFKSMFESVINILKGLTAPATPEKVFFSVPSLITQFMFFAFNPSLILTAIGISVVGTKIDISPISETMNRLFNPELILSFTIGAIFCMAIKTPLEYYAKRTFRPFKPDPLTLFGLYTRGFITREELKTELSYVTGFVDKYIDGLIDILEYNPSLFDLLRFADFVELDDDFIDKSLKVLGIKEDFKKIIKNVIKLRPLREERRILINQLVTMYAKGFISREFLSTALDSLKLQKQEKEFILSFADNKRFSELLEERINILRRSFEKGLISEETLRSRLEKLGLQIDWINLIIERGKLSQKIELPAPRVTRSLSIEFRMTVSTTTQVS
jgi:hypothetical protein